MALVGAVPSGLPTPCASPGIRLGDVAALVGSAAGRRVRRLQRRGAHRAGIRGAHRREIDPNREFLALGAANVAAGLTGGFALSASGSRTAIIDAMRAHTQVAGLVAAASVVLVVLVAPGLVALIPKATLAGIVVYAGLHLVRVGELRRLARFRSTELGLGLALAAIVGVLVFDVLAGILVAMALSVADLFARVARPPAEHPGTRARARRSAQRRGLPRRPDRPRARGLPLRRAAVLRQRDRLPGARPRGDRLAADPGAVVPAQRRGHRGAGHDRRGRAAPAGPGPRGAGWCSRWPASSRSCAGSWSAAS